MLATLIRFSIRYSGVVVALAVLLMAFGVYRFMSAGLDIFPEFAPKRVIIQTEAPGLAAEQVEVLVTLPIETAIRSLIGLEALRSESIQGLSIITATFAEDSDIYRNRQLVSERLASVGQHLPAGIGTPVAVPLSSSSSTVLTIGLSSDSQSMMELRSMVDWSLAPRLLAVPGVADVNVFGGDVRQLQVQVRPEALQRFNLSLDEVVAAAGGAAQISGAGFIENSNQRFTLQVSGQPASPEQFKSLVVKRQNGSSITLADVADIQYAAAPPISAAQIMGKPGVVLMIIGQFGANTLSVSRQVENVLAGFAPLFKQQGVDFYSHLFRPADYIETSVHNLAGHLLFGGLFVVVILYLFLFNFRSAFIAALAIPLSLISAVIVLLEMGVNLNIMVLGGLAIALGEVVDDAIIDTENIFRRLRENQRKPRPTGIAEVIQQASLEVRGSVVYASFIVALVFVPLLTLSGVAGRLFSPLGYSYILAILMSLLVALTLTPALCHLLLKRNLSQDIDPPLIKRLKPLYAQQLQWVMRHFKAVALSCLLLFLLGVLAFLRLDHKFLPELREGHFIVHTASVPGTSLTESIRVGSLLTEQFLAVEGVESVSQWAGRAERGADTYGSHYSEYEVRLKPLSGAGQQRVLEDLRDILDHFPGIHYEANTFLTERVDETISGYTAPVVVNIFGNDLAALDAKAQAAAKIIQTIPGAVDVQMRSPPATSILDVRLNLDQLQFRGISPAQVMLALETAYEGRIVGKNIQGNRIFNVAVTLPPELKTRADSLRQIALKNADGERVLLGQVAEIRHSEGRYNILHQGGLRAQSVTCNVEGRDMDAFMRELKSRLLNDIVWSSDSYPEFIGAAIEQAKARRTLILQSLMAGAGVLVFIYIALGSMRHMLLTLVNLPFALLGGVLAVVLTDAALSVGSFVGFVTLFGITVRNCIMLISHYRHLIEREGQSWSAATALRGAQERLPSILMTALVTALAMLPVAFDSDNPGREIMGPMAAIIIGGLVSSTLLNLLLLPAILLRYGRFEVRANSPYPV
ncbi:MAG: efflux RND transporter permease subunit [Methylomonas sp.]|jgi:CzcA family heavy metal efflux pump|uniref:efflux RND transporter permease subunit n=1 Tax=Methylomonas sp. TaxID=418 RepID=UPI0025E6C7D3|nr:efflux RND transporter permease subunit [Methylomonas sp.]MCK9607650.1 efflux RND transporter permease subunit [Methylomonas sp.]